MSRNTPSISKSDTNFNVLKVPVSAGVQIKVKIMVYLKIYFRTVTNKLELCSV